MSLCFRFPAAVVCCFALVTQLEGVVARAQWPARPGMRGRMAGGMGQRVPTVEAAGTIEALGPGLVKIKTPAGEPWMLQVLRDAKIHVTGTAKKDVLKAGTFVSFTAEVDMRQSQVQGPVAKLAIVTPSRERLPGAFPDQARLGPGADAGGFGAPAFAPGAPQAKPKRRRQKARAKDTGPAVERFEIVGQIRGVSKDGKLLIYAPNRYFRSPLEAELAETCEIELDLANVGVGAFKLAKRGDHVEGRGRQVGPAAVQVTELTIELAEPYSTAPPKKPPLRQTRRSRRTKAEEPKEAVDVEKEPQEAKQEHP